jgi:Spy/CpxP family protein refolding chaperone
MKKSLILFMAIACIAGTFSVASARRAGRGPMHYTPADRPEPGMHPILIAPWERIMELADDVNLDDEQLEAIEKARDVLRDLNDTLVDDLDDLRTSLHDIMVQIENADLNSALDVSRKMNDLRGKLHENRIKAAFELKKILTPEQQEQLQEMFREHRREWSKRKQDFGDRSTKRNRSSMCDPSSGRQGRKQN